MPPTLPLLDLPFLAELTALRRDIHAHPELAFNENRYFWSEWSYARHYASAAGLRPHLQIELTARTPVLPPQVRRITTLADQLAALQAQAVAERDRFRLADLRYRNGIANYLDLLDAQRSLFAIEQSLAQVRLAQRANEVQLYKALGGGWTEYQAPAPAAAAAN